ncbi:uncharacterized protein LOC127247090 isoform X2 [Andrographis paniculata]|uniref:uncharacterized protein LOC127247090 isoform X2 n=1 Tax=Andrographis paniculata TaxID=175694 RepID=UPI0021E73F30|nr:uncharacterized protein LOC127247090 isoform X2 [Andrographis paniculata]
MANTAPESDTARSASEESSGEFKTLVNSQDLDSIRQTQNLVLGRLQDSNAVLSHFNEYSENCFAEVSAEFAKNARLLRSMKSDLDFVFQKLRSCSLECDCTLQELEGQDC